MAVSTTYAFAPSSGEVLLYALSMCGIRPTAITQEHMFNGRMAANFLLASWANKQVNLWNVDLIEVALVQGTATYNVDPTCVMILDAYIRTGDGTDAVEDRVIFPISRTEYASYPNKSIQAPPTVFWFDRLLSPTITLWQVPDGNGPYLLRYYRVTQIADATLNNATQPAIPYLWLDAFATGIAARLATIYAPDRAMGFATLAEQTWNIAAGQNVENVNLYIQPGLGGYYVR